MNVFRLSDSPEEAARFHCDKHVNKMLLEAGQLLCTVLRRQGYDDDYLYQKTHTGHPILDWIEESQENFYWVKRLALALNDEKEFRYGGSHKTHREVITNLPDRPPELPDVDETPQYQAMPDMYKRNSPVMGYRVYYVNDKDRIAEWNKGREMPSWYKRMLPRAKRWAKWAERPITGWLANPRLTSWRSEKSCAVC